jgi:hypothetical protein
VPIVIEYEEEYYEAREQEGEEDELDWYWEDETVESEDEAQWEYFLPEGDDEAI